jgi:hypothetical protein
MKLSRRKKNEPRIFTDSHGLNSSHPNEVQRDALAHALHGKEILIRADP